MVQAEWKKIWEELKEKIKEEITIDESHHKFLFDGLSIFDVTSEMIILKIKMEPIIACYIIKKYSEELKKLFCVITGKKYKVIFAIYESEEKEVQLEQKQFPVHFDNDYILKSENKEAYDMALLVAEDTTRFFGTFCIFAPSGYGKSQLVYKLGKNLEKENKKVFICSCEHLMDTIYQKIKNSTYSKEKLYQELKYIDVLILENIEVLSDKYSAGSMIKELVQYLVTKRINVIFTETVENSEHVNYLDYDLCESLGTCKMPIEKPSTELKLEILRKTLKDYIISSESLLHICEGVDNLHQLHTITKQVILLSRCEKNYTIEDEQIQKILTDQGL